MPNNIVSFKSCPMTNFILQIIKPDIKNSERGGHAGNMTPGSADVNLDN